MNPVMAEDRVRLVVVIDDELRAALRLEAAKQDVDMSEIIAQLLRDNLAESLEEVRQRRKARGKKGKGSGEGN
jgi:hypothetical protein